MKKDIVSTRNKAEQLLKVLSQMGKFIPNEKTKHTDLLDATECIMIELLKDADAEFYVSGVLFKDLESGEIISKYDLEKEYEILYKNGETEIPTFTGYIRNCLSKNGTLEIIK